VPEVPLLGGTANRGLVVRVGDTVRRPWRPTSPAVHALLGHLDRVGFAAPRFLGVDPRGREILSYVEGRAITPPYPAWALTDAALTSVAELLRGYHEAVAGFDPAPYGWPPAPPDPYGRPDLVLHNDPNLDNVVFRGGRAYALIDFDLASPGTRVWDVAAAVRLWAPLRPAADVPDARRGRSLARFRLFADAYGLTPAERGRLVDAVIANHDWLYDLVRDEAEAGHPGFADYWAGARDRAARTRSWYVRATDRLRAALA
jgi:hypothetical protein